MKYIHRIRNYAKKQLRRHVGVDVVRYPLYRILDENSIDLILDVGANRGQFAEDTYEGGYNGRMVSFEPIPEVFDALKILANKRDKWDVVNKAIGRKQCTQTMCVTASDPSSSFYDVDKTYAKVHSKLALAKKIDVDVDTLNNVGPMYTVANDRVFVKIDVQGAELDVIEGGADFLAVCYGLQVETSLVQLYKRAPVVEEVVARLRTLGFVPVHVLPGFKDPKTWHTYDCDMLFLKKSSISYS